MSLNDASTVLGMDHMQSDGVLMNIKCLYAFLAVFLVSSCGTGSIDFVGLESAEAAFNERQRNNLPIYMSLKDLFPDENARALARAAGDGKTVDIRKLVDSGVSVDVPGVKRVTPLFYALRSGNIDGVTKLLELGADPNMVYEDGLAIMHFATILGDVDFMRILLKYGGNPNLIAGEMEETPIFLAIHISNEIGCNELLKLFIDSGSDINFQRKKGDTPAMAAAGAGRFDAVYQFLAAGADHSIKNEAGYDLVDWVNKKKGFFNQGSEEQKWLYKTITLLRLRGIDI